MSKAKNPIFPRGKTLWFRISYKGQQIRKSTGFKIGQEAQAFQVYLDFIKELEDIDNGLDTNKTIEDALLRWVEDYLPYLQGQSIYKSHIRSIMPYVKNQPLKTIYKIASEIKIDQRKNELSNSTINRRLSILKRISSLAYSEWQWLKESPYKKISLLKENSSRTVALSKDEVQKLSDACPNVLVKNLVLFAAYTGLRTAEIFRLDSSSLKDDILEVQGKGHRKRFLPLKQPEIDFVIKFIPIQLPKSTIRHHFRASADSAGFNHVRFHDLRHTFGTWLAKNGVQLNRIMSLMGHETVVMAQRYINMCVDDYKDDMPTALEPKKQNLKLVNLHKG